MTASADLYPLIAVVGPTASGKSDLALVVAERFGGEVVNYDSVQLYRGFDIGSAKLPVADRREIPHHAIDILNPLDVFSAGDYAGYGRAVLSEIRQRGRLPVLAGGTGFYLRALLDGLFPGPRRDEGLRQRLEQRAAERSFEYLHRLLTRLDVSSARRIHANDTPKLIRAIEVSLIGRKPMSELWGQGRDPLTGYQVLRVGLDPDREKLYERIDRRAGRMFDKGLVDETQRLLESGVSRSARPFTALGYREALSFLDGKFTREQAAEETARNTRRYAKRQMTWFRRESDVKWLAGFGDDPSIQREAIDWLEARLADRA